MEHPSEVKLRIRDKQLLHLVKSAEEAAALFRDGMVIGMGGFTPTGYPKVVPPAVAERVKKGERLKFYLETGASVGPEIDMLWSSLGMISSRVPYQTDSTLRNAINKGEVDYVDQHLSHAAQYIKSGVWPAPDIAVVEAVAITEDGGIVPTAAVGNAATFVQLANKVIIELNIRKPLALEGMADIFLPKQPPFCEPIEILHPSDRIGKMAIPCDRNKIAAIVISEMQDQTRPFKEMDEIAEKISRHVITFLKSEVAKGKLPSNLGPLQSGVGSVANAVFSGLAKTDFSGLTCYTEVVQDSMLDLIRMGKITVASATAVSPSPKALMRFESELDFFKDKIILRPQEISNNPEVIRRLGLISINTGMEMDIYGNVNSTHVLGKTMMNGIGGSGDFARNARLSIFAAPSIAKGGAISSIVPMVSHVDHTEHDVMVLVTEQGLADIRGLSPRQRAGAIIENCAHPDYRDALMDYHERACQEGGHTPHILSEALSWHVKFEQEKRMK